MRGEIFHSWKFSSDGPDDGYLSTVHEKLANGHGKNPLLQGSDDDRPLRRIQYLTARKAVHKARLSLRSCLQPSRNPVAAKPVAEGGGQGAMPPPPKSEVPIFT